MGCSSVKTNDGSYTVRSEKFGVTYHSVHGAWTETQHVFIRNGLEVVCRGDSTVHILEMGLGTGLNALAAMSYSRDNQANIHYCGLEKYPLSRNVIQDIVEDWNENVVENVDFLLLIHDLEPDQVHFISTFFSFEKHFIDMIDYQSEQLFNLIFYDAFGPETQPELWDLPTMQQMYSSLVPGGMLVTYCAQGQFKRNLKSAGFVVETLPGPPGKREMTRAVKPIYTI